MRIALESGRVTRWLAVIAAGLVAAHGLTRYLGHRLDDYFMVGVGPLFDLDDEGNLPALYATLTLLLAAAILAGIASCERGDRSRHPYWHGLAAIFAVLAVDEAAQLHELVGGLIESQITTTGYFFYSWIVPYAVLAAGLFLLYGRFLLRLPPATRAMIVAAGVIYAAGVISLEAVAARHDELYGQNNWTFGVLATVEEVFEMGGLVLFVYALLAYAEREHGGLWITIGGARSETGLDA